MSDSAEKGAPRYAPNYDVPENVSPFVPLPQLVLCAECREPVEPLQTMVVVTDGHVREGLCSVCAVRPIPPGGARCALSAPIPPGGDDA